MICQTGVLSLGHPVVCVKSVSVDHFKLFYVALHIAVKEFF